MFEQSNKNRSVLPMPLFQQVKDEIKRRILDGTFAPHDKLPSERELTEQFKMSRVTIRQALSELQREGLIFKINGKGTFVSKPKASFDVSTLKGFGESASTLGQEAFSKLISVSEHSGFKAVNQKLNLPAGDKVIRIQRLRYLNREPLAFDITYAPKALGERIASSDLERRDIFEILENDCQLNIDVAQVAIEAMLSDKSLATQLNTESGSAIMHIERTILDENNQPLLYENLYYRGDNFKFGMNVSRSHLSRSI